MAPYDDSFVRNASEGYFSQDGSSTLLDTLDNDDDINDLPANERIFVNDSVDLASIDCVGFDMDYTLCEYMSPALDQLGHDLAKQWLVENKNYNRNILEIKYDPSFVVRGLWFDKLYGNLLKVDQFGHVLQAFHGFHKLSTEELESVYPKRISWKDSNRVYIMNTPFNLPETFLIAALIDHFNKEQEYSQTESGWSCDDGDKITEFSFKQLFQDIRQAIDDIHLRSMDLKKTVLQTPELYIKTDSRLSPMLLGIRMSGKKVFLLTNSDFRYTKGIMTFLLGDEWHSYFDLVVVDACKPKYFQEGTNLRILDRVTGDVSPGTGGSECVYSGGNHSWLSSTLQSSSIIYCGDHLFADIIMCRKLTSWRTLLIIQELEQEQRISKDDLLQNLEKLESLMASNPKLSEEVNARLEAAVTEYDRRFGQHGSLFRCRGELSFFGAMVNHWSQIYTGSINNLINYNLNTRFIHHQQRLPHE